MTKYASQIIWQWPAKELASPKTKPAKSEEDDTTHNQPPINIISLSFVAVQESIIPWYENNNCLAQEYFRVIQIEDDENKTESAKSHWHLSLKLFNVILLDGSLR